MKWAQQKGCLKIFFYVLDESFGPGGSDDLAAISFVHATLIWVQNCKEKNGINYDYEKL